MKPGISGGLLFWVVLADALVLLLAVVVVSCVTS